eukprot:Gregarina_sp_Poly_1__7982@NODE_456_length_8231_cov_365_403356_g371_i0_p1_GENE_NODE_456_length_8231_cov_365_403356_g371_i0NODE_456_length_8231_cov_365_403356_g371_i0_p1_ORF_typecomplete_len970_score178_21ZZ/PF00569_17/4_2e09Myb_DNAbinding/PF00249_31/9e06Myb_DNAbind_6/PF13921_6/1_4e04Myb_DNAbind_6/PF13921_6/0_00038C1_2/PF03107_16/0_0091_NODE_456_length_8231_cov_365_403356_g371_i043197228
MYNPGGNPWETPSGAHTFVAAPLTFTGIPVSYDLSRKTLAVQQPGHAPSTANSELVLRDEPWPQKGQERAAYVHLLCVQVLRRVYEVLIANKAIDNLPRACLPNLDLDAPPPMRRSDDPLPAPTADVNPAAFAATIAFPSFEEKTDISLAAKLALSTPAHPDLLNFNGEEVEELIKLIQGNDNVPGNVVSPADAIRAARITSQWLRESFGDDTLPKPSGELVAPQPRRTSVSKEQLEGTDSTAPAATVNVQFPFHCNACKTPMRLQSFRIRCAECEDFDLCESCFCEGREVQSHKREHYFIPIGPNQFPLFHPQWTADEELFLLDAVGKYGFGNWHDVSEQVAFGTSNAVPVKDKEACEKRYFDFHLSSKEHSEDEYYPFSSLINKPRYAPWKSFLKQIRAFDEEAAAAVEKGSRPAVGGLQPRIVSDAESHRPMDPSKIKVKESLIMDIPQLPPKVHILGFLPCRGDFEIEWENHAELAIADLEIRENESPMEKEVKLKMLEYYNSILDDRIRRKKMMIEKRLYDTKLSQQVDRLRSPEEKSIHELLKPLWKHFYVPYMETKSPLFTSDRKIRVVPPLISETELDELVRLLLEDETLTDRLNKLTLWRRNGLKTLEQVLNFDSGGAQDMGEELGKTSSVAENVEDVTRLKPGNRHLSPLESEICDELQVREEFLIYIKKMIQQEVEASRASGAMNIDPETGLKVLQLEEGDMVPLNDFIVDAHIEVNSELVKKETAAADAGSEETAAGGRSNASQSATDSAGGGLVIPRKRKQPPSKRPSAVPRVSARVSPPPETNSASELSGLLPSLESVTHESGTQLTASPTQLATVHPQELMMATQLMQDPHVSQSLYVSPLASELCPRSPSSDSGLVETEEGEIEEDDETSKLCVQQPPPPPPIYNRARPADSGLGKGGKGEKRARRGSGGLTPAAASMESEDESIGEEEDSQRKSVSLLSSDVQPQSDEDLLE